MPKNRLANAVQVVQGCTEVKFYENVLHVPLYDHFASLFDQIDWRYLSEQADEDDEEDLQLHVGSGGVEDLEMNAQW